VVVEVVVAVSVVVADVVPLMETEVGERPQVAALVGLEMLVVTAQVRETVPENESFGVTVMVAVFELVAPAATVRPPLLLKEKLVVPVPVLGACQKSPQPETKTAMRGIAKNRILFNFPLRIPAPCAWIESDLARLHELFDAGAKPISILRHLRHDWSRALSPFVAVSVWSFRCQLSLGLAVADLGSSFCARICRSSHGIRRRLSIVRALDQLPPIERRVWGAMRSGIASR
jgi:hypothetical protein